MDRRTAFGRVIREFREAAQLTQPQLADRLEDVPGLKQADISKIETGRHKSPEMHLAALADALSVRASDITLRVDELLDGATTRAGNKAPKAPPPQVVPLVGWISAGKWDQVENPFDPEVAEGLVQTNLKVSRRGYALRVKGDSMTNPSGWPSFPAETTIIVDPAVEPLSGRLVIAQIDEVEEATFKKLVIDGGRNLLLPLNPQYPTIIPDRPMRVTGVVIGIAERPL